MFGDTSEMLQEFRIVGADQDCHLGKLHNSLVAPDQ